MTPYSWFTVVCWVVLIGYWLLRAKDAGGTVRGQKAWVRWLKLPVVPLFYWFMYAPSPARGWLGIQILPHNDVVGIICVLISGGGVALAIWARRILGTNWSDMVVQKKNHKNIKTGPYRLIRHPIYAGFLGLFLGSVMTIGQLRGVVFMGLILPGIYLKARWEEKLLSAAFPNEYPAYKKSTKALIPFLL
jgi:protein-S-isoprenylcysteine O-methyltransferase